MPKKSALHFRYDSPVTLSFVLLGAAIFALDFFVLKGFLTKNIFSCRVSSSNQLPEFDYKNFLDYIRLFTYVLGNSNLKILLANSTFLLLLGPSLEERYGSAVLLLMILTSALVSGVLNACLLPSPDYGAKSIVFMMICLAAITAFANKDIPLSWILVFILYFALSLSSSYKTDSKDKFNFLSSSLNTLTSLAGGITGSLFGFLVSPKKRTAASKTKNSKFSEKTLVEEKSPSKQRDENSSAQKSSSSSDETIIGSIKF